MSHAPYRYTAYGLRIRSALALPFLPDSGTEEPDVTVRLGAVPPALPAPAGRSRIWESAPGAFLLNVDRVARYLVTDGRDIVVEPAAGADVHEAGVFLTSSVFAALLQQRGILTLHASAIETETGAVLFLGCSGHGKSALLAAMLDRGYAMLADDVTGVVLDAGGHPVALSAFPTTRLWADVVDELGWRQRTQGKVRAALEKYLVPVERFRAAPLVVRAAFVLAPRNRDGIEIETQDVAAAFRSYWRHTYREKFLHGLGRQPAHFRAVSAMAKRVPVTRVTRPAWPHRLAKLAERVEAHLRAERRERPAGVAAEPRVATDG